MRSNIAVQKYDLLPFRLWDETLLFVSSGKVIQFHKGLGILIFFKVFLDMTWKFYI